MLALRTVGIRHSARLTIDGAVLGPAGVCISRFFAPDGADRLLVVNLGRDLHMNPAPEPLLAQRRRKPTHTGTQYGRAKTRNMAVTAPPHWIPTITGKFLGEAAVVLAAKPHHRPGEGDNVTDHESNTACEPNLKAVEALAPGYLQVLAYIDGFWSGQFGITRKTEELHRFAPTVPCPERRQYSASVPRVLLLGHILHVSWGVRHRTRMARHRCSRELRRN